MCIVHRQTIRLFMQTQQSFLLDKSTPLLRMLAKYEAIGPSLSSRLELMNVG